MKTIQIRFRLKENYVQEEVEVNPMAALVCKTIIVTIDEDDKRLEKLTFKSFEEMEEWQLDLPNKYKGEEVELIQPMVVDGFLIPEVPMQIGTKTSSLTF